MVYVGSDDGYLYAVDVQSGQQKWAFKTGGKVRGSLAVAGGAVYFRSGHGILYAVDIQSGRRRWRFTPSLPVVSSPAVAGGAVYVATSKGRSARPPTPPAISTRWTAGAAGRDGSSRRGLMSP